MKKEALYKILGLPPNYAKSTLNVSEVIYKKLETMCKNLPTTAVKVYVKGDIGGLVNLLVEIRGLNSVYGVDFKEVFTNVFNKEENLNLPFNKIVILYGVGGEQAVNASFPAQVLKGTLKTLEEHNCQVFVQSNLPYSTFLEKYGIPFTNKLSLPNKEEVKIC